jgi:hypothetical protein
MVYEWLCGLQPYQGDPVAVGMQHLTAPIPSLCMHNNALSPGIEAVVHQAMAKDPKQRFGDTSAFANALSQAANGQLLSSTVYVPRPLSTTSGYGIITSQPPQMEPLQQLRPIPPVQVEVQPTSTWDTLLQWFVVSLEVILACRFFFKLIDASPSNLFAGFLYGLTNIILFPFLGIVGESWRFEWKTIIAMIIYALLFWFVRGLLVILTTAFKKTKD